SALLTAARGSASSPGQAANADAALYGERWRSGGPSGSICHHVWPASASQSTQAYASRPRRPPGSEVGCSWTPLEKGRSITRRLAAVPGDTHRPMPVPNTKGNPPRIVIQYPAPTVDAGRYPVKRVVGETVRVTADVFRDGPEILRAVVAGRSPFKRVVGETFRLTADVFRDGHETLRAVVRYRGPASRRWVEAP